MADCQYRMPGRLSITSWLPEGVDDVWNAPWYAEDHHIALDTFTWQKLPVERVPTAGLRRTQKYLAKKHLVNDTEREDWPWIAEWHGEHWIIDGHHRAVGAIINGQPAIEAHVMHIVTVTAGGEVTIEDDR